MRVCEAFVLRINITEQKKRWMKPYHVQAPKAPNVMFKSHQKGTHTKMC